MKLSAILAAILLLTSCSSIPPARERISVDLRAPRCTADSAEAYFDRFLSVTGLKAEPVNVFYYPDDDVVCLHYKVDLINYYQFWSRGNRDVFISCLQQYKEDYEQRTLINKNQQTKRIYGRVLGYAIWELSRISSQGRCHPDIEIGYYFRSKAPFFSLTQREAENVNEQSRDSYQNSVTQVIYFTLAQADQLAALFEQDYLQGLSPDTPERDNVFQRLFN
jgi:hypothetical protein